MSESAQFVYLNGKAFTANDAQPWAQALATSANSIVHVGDSEGAQSLISDETTVIDLGGKVLLPGIVASHEHPLLVMGLSSGLQLEQTDDKEQVLAGVSDDVRNHPHGPMFSMGGAWEGTVDITRGDFGAIVPGRPFFMIGLGVHSTPEIDGACRRTRYTPLAMFANLVKCGRKASRTMPVGPERCLATRTSAVPMSAESES